MPFDHDTTTSTALSLVYAKDGEAFTTSNILATYFDKAHFNVLQSIDNMLEDHPEFSALNFQASEYVTDRGRTERCFEMTKDGFAFVALGFTTHKAALFKIRYIAEFNRVIAELQEAARIVSVQASTIEALQAAMADLTGKVNALLVAPTSPKARKEAKDPRVAGKHTLRYVAEQIGGVSNLGLGRWMRKVELLEPTMGRPVRVDLGLGHLGDPRI